MKNEIKTNDFYCKKCKRTFRAFYIIASNDNTPVVQNFAMKCHHCCNRVVMLKDYNEGKIKENMKQDKFYLLLQLEIVEYHI